MQTKMILMFQTVLTRCAFIFSSRFLLACLPILSMGVFACSNSVPPAQTPASDSLGTSVPGPPPVAYGIVIGENVNVRSAPSVDSARVFKVSHQEIVVVGTEKSEPVNLDQTDNLCDFYPWVRTQNGSGEWGWIFGRYLFAFTEDSSMIPGEVNTSFSLEGKIYSLTLCHDLGLGASDEKGLTGCEDFFPVIVHSAGWREAHLPEFRSSPHSRFPFWNLLNDSGTQERISGVQSLSDSVAEVLISYRKQEDSGQYRVRLFREKGKWVAEAR